MCFDRNLIIDIKENDLDDEPVTEHKCAKQGYDIDFTLVGPHSLKEAILDRKMFEKD